MSDFRKEENIDVLNNAKNSMMDNFRSIKWIFHQIDNIKGKMCMLEGKKTIGDGDNIEPTEWMELMTFNKMEANFDDLTIKW